MSESEEAEEPTNRKVRNRTLSLVYSSASACDSDNAVSLDRKRSEQNIVIRSWRADQSFAEAKLISETVTNEIMINKRTKKQQFCDNLNEKNETFEFKKHVSATPMPSSVYEWNYNDEQYIAEH